MNIRRGKTVAEKYTEQHGKHKEEKPLTAAQKRKIELFRKRIAETSSKTIKQMYGIETR